MVGKSLQAAARTSADTSWHRQRSVSTISWASSVLPDSFASSLQADSLSWWLYEPALSLATGRIWEQIVKESGSVVSGRIWKDKTMRISRHWENLERNSGCTSLPCHWPPGESGGKNQDQSPLAECGNNEPVLSLATCRICGERNSGDCTSLPCHWPLGGSVKTKQ